MSKPQVTALFKPDGTVVIETTGVVGKGCEALSKEIEDAIGIQTSNEHKPEYHQQVKQPAVQATGR